MSVKFYDEAVKAKLKALFNNTEYQSRELINKTVTDKQGEVKFPLIGIFRPDGYSLSSDNTWMEGREYLDDIRQAKIDLSYTIDIYANTREDLEDLTAEVLLYLLRNPGIVVHYMSSNKKFATDVKTNLSYVSGPERTSELDDTTVGRPYRYTLVYALENAYIMNFRDMTDPTSPDYGSKVTQVIVSVEPEIEINAEDDVFETKYIHKEEYHGENNT